MNYPTSIYPQSKPLSSGLYLIHDDIMDKWKVARWNNTFKTWEGGYLVDVFIPYKLSEEKGLME